MKLYLKLNLLTLVFGLLISGQCLAQANSKDFTFDPKTSSVIPNYVGKIILIRGKASAASGNNSRSLKRGDKIYKQETISTGKRSIVKLELVDSSIVTVGVNSQMKFDKWAYRTRSDRDAIINLIKGKVRTHFKVKSKKPEQLKLRVGHVSMGIRGTKILGSVSFNKNGDRTAQMALIQGVGRLHDQSNDYERKMLPGDYYTSQEKKNGSKGVHQYQKLSQSELKHFLAAQISADKGFRPMLEDVQFEHESSGVTDDNAGDNPPSRPAETGRRRGKRSWKDKLNDLNNRLHENDE